jgi:hypothetical protein
LLGIADHQVDCGYGRIVLIVGFRGLTYAMADELFALATLPADLPAEADYDALCPAIMGTARGRWFLQEYARRNRHADTERLVEAIARIEAVVRGDRTELADRRMRINLLEMARSIAQTRAEIAGIGPERMSSQSTSIAAAQPPQLSAQAEPTLPSLGPSRSAAVPARPRPMPRPAENDPLAALKAMSEEERLALFT